MRRRALRSPASRLNAPRGRLCFLIAAAILLGGGLLFCADLTITRRERASAFSLRRADRRNADDRRLGGGSRHGHCAVSGRSRSDKRWCSHSEFPPDPHLYHRLKTNIWTSAAAHGKLDLFASEGGDAVGAADQEKAGQPRILIVEDEPLIALMLTDMLSELGFTVTASVTQVPEALAILEEISIDAALLDVNLGTQKIDPVADAAGGARHAFRFHDGLWQCRRSRRPCGARHSAEAVSHRRSRRHSAQCSGDGGGLRITRSRAGGSRLPSRCPPTLSDPPG